MGTHFSWNSQGRRILACSVFLALAGPCLAVEWLPLDPALLAQKEPAVERGADAEVVLWDVRLEWKLQGSYPQTVTKHHVRTKIFTERGAKDLATVDLPAVGKLNITELSGRTIKPDGTVVELKRDAIFERTMVKAKRFKVKVRSFALPAVEPGAVIEYTYKEVQDEQIGNYVRMHFQREIPVREVRYHVKPLTHEAFPYRMRSYDFQAEHSPFEREPTGFIMTTMKNVPAYREEPDAPPEDQVKPWTLLYYAEDKNLAPEKYWKEFGRDLHKELRNEAKVGDEIRKLAAELTQGLTSDEEKLKRLAHHCRTQIRNVFHELTRLKPEERDKYKPNKSPADTLKQGMGTGRDILRVFAALAMAAGYDARLVRTSDRSDIFFHPSFTDPYFLVAESVAIKLGEAWRFYDPASTYNPEGMLSWREEFTSAMISDPKEPAFVPVPITAPERTVRRRAAEFTLLEDGTLEGAIDVTESGHAGIEWKHRLDDLSEAERDEVIRDEVQSRVGGAEVTDIKVLHASDPDKVLTWTCRVRVPGYAQRTGKRMFLQPSVLQRHVQPRYAASERKHDVYMDYPWMERDIVTIKLPDGFALDQPSSPGSLSFGKPGEHTVKLLLSDGGRTLHLDRTLVFGREGMIYYPAASYPQIKKVFDTIHQRDAHALTLKQATAAAAPSGQE